MCECYCIDDLKRDIGYKVVPSSCDAFHLSQLDEEIVGFAYILTLSKTIDKFFEGSWLECIQNCNVLLDITWEYLYTGHWKDVPITWRRAYAVVSYLKALSEVALAKQNHYKDFREIIRTCDMGILMGAPLPENILPKLASTLQQLHIQSCTSLSEQSDQEAKPDEPATKITKLAAQSVSLEMSPDHQVSVCVSPSVEHFRINFMETEIPVIIRGCMDFWPAMGTRCWSLSYFKQVAGWRLVPVEVGSKYTEDSWSQKLMTVNEFIDGFVEKIPSATTDVGVGYLAQHQLFDQITELKSDVIIPAYCGLGECDDVDINAWFGPSGTVSPLHQDAKHNFLAQVVGQKYIRLYSVDYTSRIYPHSSHLLSNTSQVDVEKPDLEKFPLFADVPYLECILSPGEMLYIPPMHWHFVRSLSTSFSVSFWWK